MDGSAETMTTQDAADDLPLTTRRASVRRTGRFSTVLRPETTLCSGTTLLSETTTRFETTTGRAVSISGIGLHGGAPARLVLTPAGPGSGIVFHRVDLGPSALIPARFDLVADTRLCTLLADPVSPDVRVGTVEHLMAAIAAAGVDNLVIEIDGPEVPILDGSARPFVSLFAAAGRVDLGRAATAFAVRRPIRVEDGDAFACLLPAPAFSLDLSIDFVASAIGRQSIVLDPLTERSFRAELADARTFTLLSDVDRMREAGLAHARSRDNPLVVDGGRLLNPSGQPLRPAQALLEAAIADALSLGATRLLLGTHAGNLRAIAFYRRNGFVDAGTRTFQVGSQTCCDLIFAKPLGPAGEL